MSVTLKAKRIVITLSVLILLIGSLLLAIIPGLIERWLNQYDLQSAFHKATGGTVSTGVIKLHILPTPYLTVHGGTLDIPGLANGTWREIRIHPAFKSILSGHVRFHTVSFIAPDLQLNTRSVGDEAPAQVKGEQWTAEYLRNLLTEASRRMGSGLQWLVTHAPIAGIQVYDGRLQLVGNPAQASVSLDAIDTRLALSTNTIQIDLKANASLLKTLRIAGTMDVGMQTGQLTLQFDNLDTERLSALMGLDQQLDRAEGLLSGEMAIEFKGPTVIESRLSLRLPELTLQRLEAPLRLHNIHVAGVVSIDETSVKLDFNRLHIDAPRLNATGYLQAGGEVPGLRLHIEGRGIEIAEARQATLALVGDNKTAVAIFNVLREGHVPWITWRTEGLNVAALKALRNMKLKGEVQSGQLFIPRADLELTEVNGFTEIAEGFLRGDRLSARHLATTGRGGKLWIDFNADDAPLFLEIATHLQDVGQLPPLLLQWVGNAPFQNEMRRITQVHGEARGMLMLDSRNGKGLEVTADVAQCQLTALYDRIPWGVQIEKGQVLYTRGRIAVDRMQGLIGTNRFSDLKARVEFDQQAQLYIDAARLAIDIKTVVPWLASMKVLASVARQHRIAGGNLNIDRLHLQGPFFTPSRWKYHITGRVDRWQLTTDKLPDSLHFSNFVFETDEKSFHVRSTGLKALDTNLTASGRTALRGGRLRSVAVQFKGTLGHRADKWINDLYAKDEDLLLLQTPLTIAAATIGWKTGQPTAITADFTTSQGVRVFLSEEWQRGVFRKERFQIRDGENQTIVSTDRRPDQVALAFEGTLSAKTLDRLLLSNPFPSGRITGDFQAAIVPAEPIRSNAKGQLTATNLFLPLEIEHKIHINQLQLTAEDNLLRIAPSAFRVDDNWHTLEGEIRLAADRYHVDLRHEGAYFELPDADQQKGDTHLEPYLELPIEGTIQSRLSLLKWGDQRWIPMKTTSTLAPGKWILRLDEAELCGIQTTGMVVLEADKVTLDLEHEAHNEALDPSIACLLAKSDIIDGRFNLEGRLAGGAPFEVLTQSLDGAFKFKAEDGRIYRFDLLGRILATINLTELVRGQKSDLMGEGLAYRAIDIEAQLEDNVLRLDKALINGASVEIAAEGSLDLSAKEIDLMVLVAPLKTVDALVKFTPIVNTWLEGTLVSIPVKVSGNFDDPDIVPLSPSAVGNSLLNLLKNTIQLPITLIEPLFDKDGENDEDDAP
jgi:uncharacterized protein involved in outer membrane biogenesis